jgi:hypothetical protein
MLDEHLKKYFWDADFGALDVVKHKRYLLGRILELGDEEAVRWARATFSNDDFVEALRGNCALSKKSACFWKLVFGGGEL